MKFLKTVLFALMLALTFNSCSIDDNAPDYSFEILPIESFSVPEQFETGGIYTITVQYQLPTNCHEFSGIYFEKQSDTRIIGVTSKFPENAVCDASVPALRTTTFEFECTPGYQHYIFKFFKGRDENGNAIFQEVAIPVNY